MTLPNKQEVKLYKILSKKKHEIMQIVKELLYQEKFKNSVRLLGISFSNLDTAKKEPVWVQLMLEF